MPSPSRIPSYRLHKPSGRAVVTLGGRDHYLGTYASPESKAEYKRVVGEWLTARRAAGLTASRAPDLSLAELMLAYLKHARAYYPATTAGESSELTNIRYALLPLSERYAHTAVSDFGPLALKALRESLVKAGLSRGVVNQRVGIIKRMFKWGASEELIPAGAYHALLSVEGLRRGRSAARETEPVRPVADADVEATLPFLTPTVRAMVRLQQLTGMRSGELVRLRLAPGAAGGQERSRGATIACVNPASARGV